MDKDKTLIKNHHTLEDVREGANKILHLFPSSRLPFQHDCFMFIHASDAQEALRHAINIHAKSKRLLFIHMDSIWNREGSFQDWSHFQFASLFIPSWQELKDWQKDQIKDFISLSPTSPSLKIIIGLREESKDEGISKKSF